MAYPYRASEAASGRRATPPRDLRPERYLLDPGSRAQLVSNVRDLDRNFGDLRFALETHLDHLTQYSFSYYHPDPGWQKLFADWVAWATSRGQWETTHRFDIDQFDALIERYAILDGDCFPVFRQDGTWQLYEGPQITGALGPASLNLDLDAVLTGVRVNPYTGRPIEYIAAEYGPGGGLVKPRAIPARWVVPHGFFRYEFRGVTPLACVYSLLRDKYEAVEYHLARLKIAPLIGLTVYRAEPMGPNMPPLTADDQALGPATTPGEASDQTDQYAEFNPQTGMPFFQEMAPGDRMEMLDSKTPSIEVQGYLETITLAALRGAFGIPYSMYDEAHTNFSGQRQARGQYELRLERERRQRIIPQRNQMLILRLLRDIGDGRISLPRGETIENLARNWEWIPLVEGWVDPKDAVEADLLALERNLILADDITRRNAGRSYEDTLRLRAQEREMELQYLGEPVNTEAPPNE